MKNSFVFIFIVIFLACTILFADRHGNIKAASFSYSNENWEYRLIEASLAEETIEKSKEVSNESGNTVEIAKPTQINVSDLTDFQRTYIIHGGGAISRRHIFKLL